ncbi:hypothetical protein [Stackebrandtia soli]|uniref:hypothetical protein n=1 Tax=Stackebrandtia soli TaxID=1892856 RepID=UPI0039E861D3
MDDQSASRRLVAGVRRAGSAARGRWGAWSWRWRAGVVAVAALLVAAPIVILSVSSDMREDGDAAAVVASYLEAVHRKDVDEALEFATPVGADNAVFLTADALDDAWSIEEVETAEIDGDRAAVRAVIATDDATVDTEFRLVRVEGGPWRLVQPFAEVSFAPSALGYVEVNGERVPYTSETTAERYLLFPGAYRFYTDVDGLMSTNHATIPILPGAFDRIDPDPGFVTADGLVGVEPTLGDDAEAAIAKALDALMDECASTSDEYTDVGCPFGSNSRIGELSGYEYMWDYKGMDWTVRKAPKIDVAPGPYGFVIETAEPGEVHVEGTGVEESFTQGEGFEPVGDRHVEATCEIRAEQLEAWLTEGGEFVVTPFSERTQRLGVGYVPAQRTETCL